MSYFFGSPSTKTPLVCVCGLYFLIKITFQIWADSPVSLCFVHPAMELAKLGGKMSGYSFVTLYFIHADIYCIIVECSEFQILIYVRRKTVYDNDLSKLNSNGLAYF